MEKASDRLSLMDLIIQGYWPLEELMGRMVNIFELVAFLVPNFLYPTKPEGAKEEKTSVILTTSDHKNCSLSIKHFIKDSH